MTFWPDRLHTNADKQADTIKYGLNPLGTDPSPARANDCVGKNRAKRLSH